MTPDPSSVDTTRAVLSAVVGLGFFAVAVAVLVAVAVVLTRGIRVELARARAGALPPLTSDHGGHVAMQGPVRRPDFYDWAERS